MLFMDEEIFTVKEKFFQQYDRLYAQISTETKEINPRIQKGHNPVSVMVWYDMYNNGATKIHFCKKELKTGVKELSPATKDWPSRSLVNPLD